MDRFGLTNAYLKSGAGLILLAAIAFALPWRVARPMDAVALVSSASPFLLMGGIVLYVIGRVLTVRRGRAG